jgi:two-component system LytT family sensor kinase
MMNRKLLRIASFFWLVSTIYLLIGAFSFAHSSFAGILLIASSQILLLIKILICLFYIFPRFWRRDKIPQLIISILVLSLLTVSVKYVFEEILYVRFLGLEATPNLNLYFFVYDDLYYSLPGIFAALVAFLVVGSFEAEQKHKEFKESMRQAELNFLKSQLNPHFLYNTLNYMYAMALPLSAKLADAILKLSDTMRYTLAQNEKTFTPLIDEVSFIEDYFHLHGLQYNSLLYYHFVREGEIDDTLFPPLILVPFIENAIKHGVVNEDSKPINVLLSVRDGKLTFKVTNYIHLQLKDNTSGIGLANVRRRLNILYPSKHTLQINANQDIYHITLTVNL